MGRVILNNRHITDDKPFYCSLKSQLGVEIYEVHAVDTLASTCTITVDYPDEEALRQSLALLHNHGVEVEAVAAVPMAKVRSLPAALAVMPAHVAEIFGHEFDVRQDESLNMMYHLRPLASVCP